MTIRLPMMSEGRRRSNWAGLVGGKAGLAVGLAALVGAFAGPANGQPAGKPAAATPTAAATLEQVEGTLHVCSSCHGLGGSSISPTFPRLAGQQKDYLVAQLTAFRDKTRADPHAQTYMWGMAAHLTDPVIAAIAAYYSSQPPVAGTPGTSPEIAAGATIYAQGSSVGKAPPCKTCHGETAAGNGPIPRLAGQHRAYLVRQLEAFQSRARANEVMHEQSKNLTPEQIGKVTAFLATQ